MMGTSSNKMGGLGGQQTEHGPAVSPDSNNSPWLNEQKQRDQGEFSIPYLALITQYLDAAVWSPLTGKRTPINQSEPRIAAGAGACVLWGDVGELPQAKWTCLIGKKMDLGGLAAAQSACRKVTEDAFKVGLGRKKDTKGIDVEM